MKRTVEINNVLTISGGLESKKDGWNYGSYSLPVDISGLTDKEIEDFLSAELKIVVNARIKAGRNKNQVFDYMDTLKKQALSAPISIQDLIKSTAKVSIARDFGKIEGEIKAERRHKTPESEIKVFLMNEYGLTDEQADLCLKGENPFKIEKKGSNPSQGKRSENKPSDTLTLTSEQMTALREWTILERGNSSDPLNDDSIGNILDKCDIPEKLFGIAEFFIKNVKG